MNEKKKPYDPKDNMRPLGLRPGCCLAGKIPSAQCSFPCKIRRPEKPYGKSAAAIRALPDEPEGA